MFTSGSGLRATLLLTTVALLAVNMFAFDLSPTALEINRVLQFGGGVAAVVCGLIMAARVRGVARVWRVLVVGVAATWLGGQLIWWSTGAPAGGAAPGTAVAAYFAFVLLALAAVVGLARAGSGVPGRSNGPASLSVALTVLDWLVAAVSFTMLVILGSTGSLPRSNSPAVTVAFAVIELVTVVTAMVIAMVYRPDRPYRSNYLFLVGGVVSIASSDRLLAYLHSVGVSDGEVWARAGFVLGPIMLTCAVLNAPATQPESDEHRAHANDWVQVVLPYIAFTGMAILFAFHILIGQPLPTVVVFGAVLLVLLVAARQVIAMRTQRLLMWRLYETQQRLAHQVHHDSLTGLPNRLMFANRLDRAMRDGRFVLIFVDLDDFKEVNDQFGHAAGDELLRAVGERLQRCLGEDDILARVGGDEFAILINGEREVPEVVADRLRVALRHPFAIHGSSLRVKASMGLVRRGTDDPAPTLDDLLRKADASMYAGKRLGKDTAVVYRPSNGVPVDFPTTLRRAGGAAPEGFQLVYQPVVRLADGVTVAVEALARWSAPNGIQIPPETFVAAAEAAGMGAVLDGLVLDMACAEVAAAGLDVDLHVNIGAARLGNVDFETQMGRTLARHGIAPQRLVVEITETVPIVDLVDGAAAIGRLNALGVRIALDDFGTGFNSLTYLHALPVQFVKLDRSLTVAGEPDRVSTLYRSFIRLCHDLGMEVIAEGVETSAQSRTVAAAGCGLAQGHLFGVPAELPRACVSAVRHAVPPELWTPAHGTGRRRADLV